MKPRTIILLLFATAVLIGCYTMVYAVILWLISAD